MNERRNFLKLASAAAIPAAAAIVTSGVARAQDSSAKEFLGAWNTAHSLPFPPGSFREFLTFDASGAMHETNSLLHNTSNLSILIPGKRLNAGDGAGNWYRVAHGVIQVAFRKMLFDSANQNENVGDLHVTGTLRSDGRVLTADWYVEILAPNGALIAPLGPATSTGFRVT